MRKEPIEIAPAAHSCMGGVLIDTNGRTDVDGLFVAGENGGGLHGANRLASGGLTVCAVMGDRAGPGRRPRVGRGRAARKSEMGAAGADAVDENQLDEIEENIREICFPPAASSVDLAALQEGIGKIAAHKEKIMGITPAASLLSRHAQSSSCALPQRRCWLDGHARRKPGRAYPFGLSRA